MKSILFISTMVLSLQFTYSQDTVRVYLNEKLEQVKQEKAAICRTVIIDKGVYSLTDAHVDGKKIMSGGYSSLNPITEDGEFFYYDDKGMAYASGKYHRGQMTGYWKFYYDNLTDSVDYTCLSDTSDALKDYGPYFVFCEEQASFQGGNINTFRDYVQKNLHYPKFVLKDAGGVRVTVQFAVCTDGYVRKIKILRSSGSTMIDGECIRVLRTSPVWKPARQSNRDVSQQFVIPIVFQL